MPELLIQPHFTSTPLRTEFTTLPARTMLPLFINNTVTALPTNRLKNLKEVDLNDFAKVDAEVKTLSLKTNEIQPALVEMRVGQSRRKTINFSKALINNWKTGAEAFTQSQVMMNWARQQSKSEREIVCKAFVEAGQQELAIHNIGGMEKKDARVFMKSFLSNGGKNTDVFEWMAGAGSFLRKHDLVEPPVNGWLGDAWDAVTGAVSDAADWAWGALTTVADAIDAAINDLGRAIGEIASWSISKLSDVVRSLVAAGRSVASVLAAALAVSSSVLKRFVRAVLQAGQSMLSVLNWVGGKALNIVRHVLNALFAAGKSAISIAKTVIRKSTSLSRKIVQVLIQLGHDVEDLIRAAINASARQVRRLVDAFLRAGQQIAEILRETLSEARAVINNVVKALLDLGESLVRVMHAARNLGNRFFELVVRAVITAGRSLSKMLTAVLASGMGMLQKFIRALVKIGQKLNDVLDMVAAKTKEILVATMRALRAVGMALNKILTSITRYAGHQLKNIVAAVQQIFKDPAALILKFVRKSASIIRNVLEGLFLANLSFVRALRTILENVVDRFRKGFFEGLIALGHSVVKIMGEALKLVGALAVLAFATILDVLGGHRPMNAEERRAARQIFGWSIDLDRIRIAAASLPADLILMVNGGRPFTTMHVINFASWQEVDLQTLIHELTHTWQGVEAGPVYAVEALHDQFTLGDDAYKVTQDMLAANNGNFASFGREQQGRLIELYYAYKLGERKDDPDAAAWLAALEPYARQVFRPQFTIPIPDLNLPIVDRNPFVFTPGRFPIINP